MARTPTSERSPASTEDVRRWVADRLGWEQFLASARAGTLERDTEHNVEAAAAA